MNVDILTPEHPDWKRTRTTIALIYRKAYGARLNRFMPELLKISDRQGEFRSIVGMREATGQQLFLETYLDEPIEQAIARHTGQPVARGSIIEIGNLVESRAGDARLGIIATTRYLHSLGYRWVVFTAVPQLLNAFRRLGIETVEMVEADPSRLSDEDRRRWGSYYDEGPKVCFGDIAKGYESLTDFEGAWLGAAQVAEERKQASTTLLRHSLPA